MERMNESISTLKLREERNTLVLYGSEDIHLLGLLKRTEMNEEAIENINGMPQQVKELSEKVDCLVETDKKRVNFIKGAIAGYGLMFTGIGAILIKVFS